MEVKVTGKIPIKAEENIQKSLSAFIEKNFPDLMNLSQDVLYISGFIDSKELTDVENFLLKIYSVIESSETSTVKVKNHLLDLIQIYTISENGIVLSKRKDLSAEYIDITLTLEE